MSGAFLFGKLPALGDFICRGMTAAQRNAWDSRCTAALADVSRRGGEDVAALLEATPPHGFLLAPTADEPFWQLGCAVPSCDRVGRYYLLVLGATSEAGWGEEWRPVAGRLEPCLRAAITGGLDAEAVLAMIGNALPSGKADDIETMAGWRTDWIGAAPVMNGKDG